MCFGKASKYIIENMQISELNYTKLGLNIISSLFTFR